MFKFFWEQQNLVRHKHFGWALAPNPPVATGLLELGVDRRTALLTTHSTCWGWVCWTKQDDVLVPLNNENAEVAQIMITLYLMEISVHTAFILFKATSRPTTKTYGACFVGNSPDSCSVDGRRGVLQTMMMPGCGVGGKMSDLLSRRFA